MVSDESFAVVKVGGSLFDLTDLCARLAGWRAARRETRLAFVPGGGAAADAVRDYHRTHGLREETSHWLALRMMQVNAHLLAELMDLPVGIGPFGADAFVLDAFAFAESDEGAVGALPHRWFVTSDAIAARAASRFRAGTVVLLKSVDLPAGLTWHEAARDGLVDLAFPDVVAASNVEWVNLRARPSTP